MSRPPLNLACLASYLRHGGLRVAVRDLNIETYHALRGSKLQRLWAIDTEEKHSSREVYRTLRGALDNMFDRMIEEILRSDSPVIGFSATVGNVHFVQHFAHRVASEAPGRLVIVGGPEVLRLHQSGDYRSFPAHHLVLGEGEETLLELVQRHAARGAACRVPGALDGALQPHAGLAHDPREPFVPRPPPQDLDTLPAPTYEGLDLSAYETDQMPFLFTRGCRASCVFCADRVHQGKFRCRSAAHAANEMEHHVTRYGRRVFAFNDLMCNGDAVRLRQLCDEVARRGLEVAWSSYALIRRDLDRALLASLNRAGCFDLHFGVESGSDRVLARMGKPFDASLAQQVVRSAAESGIRASVNVLVGFPGETEEDLDATLRFLEHNAGAIHQVLNLSAMTPLAGTELYRHGRRLGLRGRLESNAWTDTAGVNDAGRRQRLERVRAHLDHLGIPVRIINWGAWPRVVSPPSDGTPGPS